MPLPALGGVEAQVVGPESGKDFLREKGNTNQVYRHTEWQEKGS